MASHLLSLTDSFNKAVDINTDHLDHIAVWNDIQRIDFWDKDQRVASFQSDAQKLEGDLDKIIAALQQRGMDLHALSSNGTGSFSEYRYFYRPELVDYYEYKQAIDEKTKKPVMQLDLQGITFNVTAQEKEAFVAKVKASAPANEWLEFSDKLAAPFNSNSGYEAAFRRSKVIDLFAVPEKGHLAITLPDLYRSFVPMDKPQDKIDNIAKTLPQLVKAEAGAGAYPLYYAPSFYPPNRRHHVNVIMKM